MSRPRSPSNGTSKTGVSGKYTGALYSALGFVTSSPPTSRVVAYNATGTGPGSVSWLRWRKRGSGAKCVMDVSR
jgi:hypothetical protein